MTKLLAALVGVLMFATTGCGVSIARPGARGRGYVPVYESSGIHSRGRLGSPELEPPPLYVSADVGGIWDPSRADEIAARHRARLEALRGSGPAYVAPPTTSTHIVVPDLVTREEHDEAVNALIAELHRLRECMQQAHCAPPPAVE